MVAISRASRTSSHSRGFTLIELLLAVLVLLAVIIATARIFGTASDVTGIGQATANVLQEAAVIERYMREDIENNLSKDGVFLIRQVAVRNDAHGENQLIDPNLSPQAYLRSDQLLFFSDAKVQMQTSGVTEGRLSRIQAPVSRVYYGHAFQLPDGLSYDRDIGTHRGWAHDPAVDVVPWHRGEVDMERTFFSSTGDAGGSTSTTIFRRDGADVDVIDGSQPRPLRWLLARQPVLFQNDSWNPTNSNGRTTLGRSRTARSIFNDTVHGTDAMHPVFGWSREIRNGRLDGAGSTLAETRRYIQNFPSGPLAGKWWNGGPRPWTDTNINNDQRDVLSREVLNYPRAERVAPSMLRQDQAMTNHIIGSAVSSIIIEWTWDDGVGEMLNRDDDPVLLPPSIAGAYPLDRYRGFISNCYTRDDPPEPCYPVGATGQQQDRPEKPWFGINLDRNTWKFDLAADEGGGRGVGFMALLDPFQHDDFDEAYQNAANYHYPLSAAWWPPLDNGNINPIERYGTADGAFNYPPWNQVANPDRIHIYEAFFGYNRSDSLTTDPAGPDVGPQLPSHRWASSAHHDAPELDRGYTPWPSSLRVTLILHDPQGRLEQGREFQFTIDLPERVREQSRP